MKCWLVRLPMRGFVLGSFFMGNFQIGKEISHQISEKRMMCTWYPETLMQWWTMDKLEKRTLKIWTLSDHLRSVIL